MAKLIVILFSILAMGLDYPIVAVRAPRRGDDVLTQWQEVFHPIHAEPGSHLVIIKPDGTEEMLVSAGEKGVVLDPCPSLDGKWVYYSLIHDQTRLQLQEPGDPAMSGADIFKINVETKAIVRLTNQEWTPNTGAANWSKNNLTADPVGTNYLGYGIYNTGACPLPGGRVMFTSSRNGLRAPKDYSFPNFQLFVMDEDGRNVEQIGHLNIGSALHPVLMKNGMVAWSSWESQGYRSQRVWALWEIAPDGRNWGPLMSGFVWPMALHFAGQKSDGEVALTIYYNMSNNGLGTLVGFHREGPASLPGTIRFGSPDPRHPSNPVVPLTYYDDGRRHNWRWSFSPNRLRPLTPSSTIRDVAANIDPTTGERLGKYTHPSGAPGNNLLAIYSPGPASSRNLPTPYPAFKGEIVSLTQGFADKPADHVTLKTDDRYNYQQPKALVPWATIYGEPPKELPWLPNDGTAHPLLPKGTPYGLIGTASCYKRESATFAPNEPWSGQGADSGVYDNSEIYALRFLQTEPQSHLTRGPIRKPDWTNPPKERLRILGEIPLRKPDGTPLDPDGNPDTSFLTRLPADMPFLFQTIDRHGLVLNMVQSWHQLRPGEKRTDCGGCHSHSQPPTDFSLTAAAKPGYNVLTLDKARDVEFDGDVWPILQAKCATCHVEGHESGLVMSTPAATYTALMAKYVKYYRPRESLLMWKLFGHSLDGSNEELPGSRMPPEGDPILESERRTIIEWISVGGTRGAGVKVDDLRPTLTVAHPRRDEVAAEIIFGAIDTMSGLNLGSLKVTLDGSDITGRFSMNENIWRGTLAEPDKEGELVVSIADKQGNITTVNRSFKGTTAPPETCEEEVARLKAEIEALKEQLKIK